MKTEWDGEILTITTDNIVAKYVKMEPLNERHKYRVHCFSSVENWEDCGDSHLLYQSVRRSAHRCVIEDVALIEFEDKFGRRRKGINEA